MADRSRTWRCPSCGKPSYTDAVRRMGQDRSFSGQAIAPRCRFCHAQVKPRMTRLGWIVEGCILSLAALCIAAWMVVTWGLGLDLSAWSIPWLIGSVGIALLVIPLRRPFMRLGRNGSFRDTVYPATYVREGRKDPAFDACGVFGGRIGDAEICVSIVRKQGKNVWFRVVAPEEMRDGLTEGREIVLSEIPDSRYQLKVSGAGAVTESDR